MNYKINFKMKSPVSFQDFIMFDGVIAYAYACEKNKEKGPRVGRLSFKKEDLIDFSPMPIEMHEDGYFMASWGFYEKDGLVEHLASWKKRWAEEADYLADFGKNKRKVDIARGNFKSYNSQIRVVDLANIWFYFQSYDIEEVKRLLDTYVVGLGKKISQGYGLIDSYEIEKLDYNPFGGQIVRPIPAKETIGNMRFLGFRPPYWLAENQTFCLTE